MLERRILKQQLDLLYEQKARGYQIRSRARWVEEGEKSSGYFLSLEKERQSSNRIDCLNDSSGELRHTDDGILDVAKSFYKELYTNKPCSDENLESYFSSLQREHI